VIGFPRWTLPESNPHLALRVMVFGLSSSALGSVKVRMPFSKSALALSVTTTVGRGRVREKLPNRRSGRW
jgi:hypothetical protein